MSFRNEYLIVKCRELMDGWECDADRTPYAIVKDYSPYAKKIGYEIYLIRNDGQLFCIKDWEEKHLRKEN